MTTGPTPTIWMYGGVHNDPGSRQRFLEHLAQHKIAPHFVAVEWEQPHFESLAAQRSEVARKLGDRWDFLTPTECQELAKALAWEGDAYRTRFPGTEPLWLEAGYQEAKIREDFPSFVNTYPEKYADDVFQKLSRVISLLPPDLRSKQELVDRVSKDRWRAVLSDPYRSASSLERDARWKRMICERSTGLHDGWIAIVVGWLHVEPLPGNQRLQDLLKAQGFRLHSVRLGPEIPPTCEAP